MKSLDANTKDHFDLIPTSVLTRFFKEADAPHEVIFFLNFFRQRYENTVSHGKNYEAKNMMHVFRLLNMAEEIARYKKINVRRPEREWLLKIRAGEFSYEDLLEEAETKIAIVDELFKKSDLPDSADSFAAESILINIRETLYREDV